MANSAYDVYLDRCLLPITPEKIETKINNNNKTVTLMNEGEINILKMAGLTEIEMTCPIPQVKYPFAVYKSGFKNARYFLDYFEELKTSQKPFQCVICRRLPSGKKLFNTNITVSMEDYKITEDVKNGFDLNVKVKLKQWRGYGTKTVNVIVVEEKPKASVEPQRPEPTAPTPATAQMYTVENGDCLWNIAKKFYGNGSKYTVIYNANKGVIGGNPNLVYPGQVLTIPAV